MRRPVTLIDRDPDVLGRLEIAGDVSRVALHIDAGGEDLARISPWPLRGAVGSPLFISRPGLPLRPLPRAHHLNLVEHVASSRLVRDLAREARSAFIPRCGLAPGFVLIAANDSASRFETLDCIRLRVGALPRYPDNALGYNLTWSTEGVINENVEPCEAIVGASTACSRRSRNASAC